MLSMTKGGDLVTQLCKDSKNTYGLKTYVAFDAVFIGFNYVCSATTPPVVSLFPNPEDKQKLISLLKESKDIIEVTMGNTKFWYSSLGFSMAYSQIEEVAKVTGFKNFKLMMGMKTWDDNSALGYNKNGAGSMSYPTAEIFLTRGGTIGIGLSYGLMAGMKTANMYCSKNSSSESTFHFPSVMINNTKVRMFGSCEKYADSELFYLMVYPETERGKQYIINEFSRKGYVQIGDGYYSAKGFTQAYSQLKGKLGGI